MTCQKMGESGGKIMQDDPANLEQCCYEFMRVVGLGARELH